MTVQYVCKGRGSPQSSFPFDIHGEILGKKAKIGQVIAKNNLKKPLYVLKYY